MGSGAFGFLDVWQDPCEGASYGSERGRDGVALALRLRALMAGGRLGRGNF